MSETYRFVDCQGLAGAWTLGTVRTGRFELVHRTSQPGDFGDDAMDLNRPLVGDGWEQQSGPAPEWEPFSGVAYVCGTPPCSGFSLMNASKKENARGPDSPINSCMRDLAQYGARMVGADGRPGAEIISFESVQQAFSTGRGLMQTLRDLVEEESGQSYDLTHVMMSGASVGATQARHRYYWVAHRVPFGVDHPEPRRVGTYRDAIGDLGGLDLTWDKQPYLQAPTEWVEEFDLRSSDGRVSCHIPYTDQNNRLVQLLGEVIDQWQPGQKLKPLIASLDSPPPTLLKRFPYDESNWRDLRGWQWPVRVHPDRPGYVIAGHGASKFVHYNEPRYLTIRELTRLMGYPDDWEWPEGISVGNASKYVGKCCPVTSGQWISDWVAKSLDGEPGQRGEEIGEREYLHNSSLDYRRWPQEISGWTPKMPPLVAAAA